MSVKRDASGCRSIQVEMEVPGTPEQVWEAIATGHGISSWFVPTKVEEREGGAVTANFGPGMDSAATITAWEPPHRFTAKSQDLGPGAPKLATEWTVAARSGGACVVRVVQSLFAGSDEWDDQLEDFEDGWTAVFHGMQLYFARFRGQRCSSFHLMGVAPGPLSSAWEALLNALGVAGASAGQAVRGAPGALPFAGQVERLAAGDPCELLLRLEEPAPGMAHFFAVSIGGQVCLPIRLYLYGEQAAAAVARDEPLWRAWMNERFPSTGGAGTVA